MDPSVELTPELRAAFLDEAGEHLAALNSHLLTFEQHAEQGAIRFERDDDRKRMTEMFRAAHSLKGLSATFGFGELNRLTHRMESLFDAVRNGTRRLDAIALDGLLQCVTVLEALVAEIRAPGGPAPFSDEAMAILNRLMIPEPSPAEADAAPQTGEPLSDTLQADAELRRAFVESALESIGEINDSLARLAEEADDVLLLAAFRAAHNLKGACAAAGLSEATRLSQQMETCFDRLRGGDLALSEPIRSGLAAAADRIAETAEKLSQDAVTAPVIGVVARGVSTEPPDQLESHAPADLAASLGRATTGNPGTIRVDVERLDQLLHSGETLLAGHERILRVVQRLRELADADRLDPSACAAVTDLGDAASDVQRLSSELHENATRLRMVPVGPFMQRFVRLTRDIARELGKRIEFATTGGEIELDKRMIDGLADPLTHLVRNAADHGIEPPEERERRGKSRTGRVTASTSLRGGHVVIEIRDDGRGIDLKRVRERVVERGFTDEDRAARMADRELVQFIFHPGFSTARAVTGLSGRGMGMDIVQSRIQGLGGTVEVRTSAGQGTATLIRLPLTLAGMGVLLVRIGDQLFGLPQESVSEILMVSRGARRPNGGDWTADVGKRPIPLRFLEDLPDCPSSGLKTRSREADDWAVVVFDSGGAAIGLVVDSLIGRQKVLLRPSADSRAVQAKGIKTIFGREAITGETTLRGGKRATVLDSSWLAKSGPPLQAVPREVGPEHRALKPPESDECTLAY